MSDPSSSSSNSSTSLAHRADAAEWAEGLSQLDTVVVKYNRPMMLELLTQLAMLETPIPSLTAGIVDVGTDYIVTLGGLTKEISMVQCILKFKSDKTPPILRTVRDVCVQMIESGPVLKVYVQKTAMEQSKPHHHHHHKGGDRNDVYSPGPRPSAAASVTSRRKLALRQRRRR